MSKKWAVGQVNATRSIQDNLDTVLDFTREAADDGCSLIAFPEFCLYRGNQNYIRKNPIPLDSEPVNQLTTVASEENIHMLAGTLPVPDPERSDYFYNTALYIDDSGTIGGQYRKIHLFDIELEDEFTLRESDVLSGGEQVVDLEMNGVQCGLSICYDLRFPELYRRLAQRRVRAVFVPSNFTRETGRAHWKPLLRSRAIENQCYVIAPNQIGPNPDNGVHSLGQSLVVDPWGQIIGCASDRESWFSVEIDPSYVKTIRRQLPALEHVELT